MTEEKITSNVKNERLKRNLKAIQMARTLKIERIKLPEEDKEIGYKTLAILTEMEIQYKCNIRKKKFFLTF